VDTLLHIFTEVMFALFIIGAIGCLLVIPVTAFELFKVLFQPDTLEETAGNTARGGY
jgi:hypothetical protein